MFMVESNLFHVYLFYFICGHGNKRTRITARASVTQAWYWYVGISRDSTRAISQIEKVFLVNVGYNTSVEKLLCNRNLVLLRSTAVHLNPSAP